MIQVTKTFLPELDEYTDLLREVWRTGHVTNHGPLVGRLEAELRERLGVRHAFLTCNGTIALQIAIRALGLRGEVVTTPFSYVATTSSLVWESCTPVFADIEPGGLCLDPEMVEAACGPQTTAILATHVYGNACDTEALSAIAARRQLHLVYDAAHAFGASYRGRPLCSFGDVAIISLHATKLFHSGEGGAILTDDDSLAERVGFLRNFGHRGQEEFWGLGTNGKMSELHAALGLAVLPHVPAILEQRQALSATYDRLLGCGAVGRVAWREGLDRNHAYYPILLADEDALLRVRSALNVIGVFPRRYFFPVLSNLPYVEKSVVPVAEDKSRRVLCLPMGHDVSGSDAERIADQVREAS